MSKKNEIKHRGRIVEMTPDFTTVEILVSSACSECHAKGMCGMSEDEQKMIMLPTDPYSTYNVGDEVQVCTKMTMGLKAAWISYAIPLLILMILILTLSALRPIVIFVHTRTSSPTLYSAYGSVGTESSFC